MRSLLVTGTDTGCGKTRVACALIRALAKKGQRIAPMKPVASGAEMIDGVLRNGDALALIEACGEDWAYERVNRYVFQRPIAPHLAAREAGAEIDPDAILADLRWLSDRSDRVVIEGVGGWAVPMGDDILLAGLAARLAVPVVLVVGMRLGCLNHALLSTRRILEDGLPLVGWIANRLDPEMQRGAENLADLETRIPVPRIATLGYGASEFELEAVL